MRAFWAEDYRVIRGGCWGNDTQCARAVYCSYNALRLHHRNLGLRFMRRVA